MFKKRHYDVAGLLDRKMNELSKVSRELAELESFIGWLNAKCLKERKQLCGLRKISFSAGDRDICYIGFIMESQAFSASGRIFKYHIEGYLSIPAYRNKIVYKAGVEQQISELPADFDNKLHLVDNIVDKDIRRKGVGTAGLDIIKELAKHLHCSEIYGKKWTVPDTEENRAILTAYYNATGFAQGEGERISYDMRKYQDPPNQTTEDTQ